MRYSTIAPDSAMVLPLSVITGDLPSGWIARSSAGADAGAAALQLLATLRRRLGDAAAALETAVHADAEACAGAAAPAGAQGRQPGLDHAGQSAAQAAYGVLGRRTRQVRM